MQIIDDEVLIDDYSYPTWTSIRTVSDLNFEHGTMCRFYGCYEYGDIFETVLVYDIKPATCIVAGT